MPSPDSEVNRIARAYLRKLESTSIEPWDHGADDDPDVIFPSSGDVLGTAPLAPMPSIAGYRVMCPGQADIYVIDPEGYQRKVANHGTYNRLFRDWSGIVDVVLDHIAQRPPLARSTALVCGERSEITYLLDAGLKHPIGGAAAMDKYWFHWGRVCVVPQSVIETIPTGPAWE